MRVLGLIPARGGSKALPRKNIRLLRGKPLLQYTAEAALASRIISRSILTTDDEEIAEVGRACGLEVPFLRPAGLGRDDTPTLPVIQHALNWLEEQGDLFDVICLLEPTSPIRQPGLIDSCLDLLRASGADSVVTVVPIPAEYNPHWVYFRSPDGKLLLATGEPDPIPRRQDLPPAYRRNGSVYVSRRDVIMKQDSIYGMHSVGCVVDGEESVNIDDNADWQRAEEMLKALGSN